MNNSIVYAPLPEKVNNCQLGTFAGWYNRTYYYPKRDLKTLSIKQFNEVYDLYMRSLRIELIDSLTKGIDFGSFRSRAVSHLAYLTKDISYFNLCKVKDFTKLLDKFRDNVWYIRDGFLLIQLYPDSREYQVSTHVRSSWRNCSHWRYKYGGRY